ncbi:MAG: hypothetical protein WC827_03815 [Candidatus Paceibacterota bacterium]|jgi:hypothetical protein
MTKNEKMTEISTNAFNELCIIADKHRGSWKPIYGMEANMKWWCILYPAIHVAMNREFNTGTASGLTFPTCDISVLPISIGNKFIFPSREAAVQFGYEAHDLFVPFLYPELTILMQRTK